MYYIVCEKDLHPEFLDVKFGWGGSLIIRVILGSWWYDPRVIHEQSNSYCKIISSDLQTQMNHEVQTLNRFMYINFLKFS